MDQTVAKDTYNAIRMKHAEAHHVRETKVVMRGKNDSPPLRAAEPPPGPLARGCVQIGGLRSEKKAKV